jgi:23S rRNA (cytosine1962-C5)-methyltransferase
MFPILDILKGHHQRFLKGYPWLYANEIAQSAETKNLSPGQCVYLSFQGMRVATGYYNRHSLIAVRVLSRNIHEPIDVDFFSKRFQNAKALRNRFYPKPYYRLIHAEADGLPGLIIDRFDSVFVLQINTQGMEMLKPLLIEALQTVFQVSTLYLKQDSAIRTLETLPLLEPEMIGDPIQTLTVIENAVRFDIELSAAQKTGWFYDHQENRLMLGQLAKQKTVIDYFCYSGGFSLQAALQGAISVIGVDRSETALKNATHAAELNGVADRATFICRDVFDDLNDRIAKQEYFDIVMLDPPAFVKSKKDLAVGLKGYEKLLTKACQLVAKNGLLFIASCSYHVKITDLHQCLSHALGKLGREGRIVRTVGAGPDHPKHPFLEESDYLKGFLVALV